MCKDVPKIVLTKGVVQVYKIGGVELHIYKTNDFIESVVYILKKGGEAVVLGNPYLLSNIRELERYISDSKINVVARVLSYHLAGATFLPNVPIYSTKAAYKFCMGDDGRKINAGLAETYGADFDSSMSSIVNCIKCDGEIELAGIKMNIVGCCEAFDVEIPEIRAVYMCMVTRDSHTIIMSPRNAVRIADRLEKYLAAGDALFISSHHEPVGPDGARKNMLYLRTLAEVAEQSYDANSFVRNVKHKFPRYGGEDYLHTTARFFFSIA